MIKVAIVGAAGRMGQALVRCALRLEDIELVGAVENDQHPALHSDAGEVAGCGKAGIEICLDLQEVMEAADVMIDFSLHDSVPGNVAIAAGCGKGVIIGTTGLDDDETAVVNQVAETIPIVWAPNMSLGVNLLFATVKKAADVLGTGYSVEIDETHHIHKKDAPSGTALRLGEKVAAGQGHDFNYVLATDANPDVEAPPDKIRMRSRREGEVIGDHTVSFESEGERVEFKHHAETRDAFALGALRAATWVATQKPGLYDMQDVLGL
jgi:4-hydroxy-tetrahydrodipicolinate reductase